MIEAHRLAEVLRGLALKSTDPLQVYWCRIEAEGRDAFAVDLCGQADSVAIVPLVVRRRIFEDPNSVLSDLNEMLSENRKAFSGIHGRCQVVVALLARGHFRLAPTGSPLELPDWFPCQPGQEVYVRVRDVMFEADTVPFNAPEARIEDVASKLLQLEAVLVRRLAAGLLSETKNSASFWQRCDTVLKIGAAPKAIKEKLAAFQNHVDEISDSRAYRPSALNRSSLLSTLVSVVQRSSPDQLGTVAESFAKALNLRAEAGIPFPFASLLLRPSRELDSEAQFAFVMLTTVFASYQFLNCGAHASDYPSVSVAFLHLHSRDLRLALVDLTSLVSDLDGDR